MRHLKQCAEKITLDARDVTLSNEPENRSITFFLKTAKESLPRCHAVGHPRVGATVGTFHARIAEKSSCSGSLLARSPKAHAR